MKLFQQDKPNPATVLANWTFFALAVFMVLVFLLGEVNACGSQEFCATTIFFMVFLGSFFMLIILGVISSIRGKAQTNKVLFFYFSGISLQKLVWVPIGYLGVLGIAYATTFWNFEYAVHIGIFTSGLVMLVAFFATRSILIPVLIHGFYNSTVVLLRVETGLSNLPIQVPEIGVAFGQYSGVASEIFFQIILVAGSEEFFKAFAIAFIIVALRGQFNDRGIIKWIAGFLAVGIWTSYHMISAI